MSQSPQTVLRLVGNFAEALSLTSSLVKAVDFDVEEELRKLGVDDICTWGLEKCGKESLPPHMLVMLDHHIDGSDSWQLGIMAPAILLAEGLFEPKLHARGRGVLPGQPQGSGRFHRPAPPDL